MKPDVSKSKQSLGFTKRWKQRSRRNQDLKEREKLDKLIEKYKGAVTIKANELYAQDGVTWAQAVPILTEEMKIAKVPSVDWADLLWAIRTSIFATKSSQQDARYTKLSTPYRLIIKGGIEQAIKNGTARVVKEGAYESGDINAQKNDKGLSRLVRKGLTEVGITRVKELLATYPMGSRLVCKFVDDQFILEEAPAYAGTMNFDDFSETVKGLQIMLIKEFKERRP